MPQFFILVLMGFGLMVSGCATIMHAGGDQEVGISSSPSGAEVTIDNSVKGTTPVTVALSRKNPHTIILKKEGYEDASATTSTNVSGWVWGNILFGGLIGLAIDFISGGAYNIVPENVAVNLPEKLGLSSHRSDASPITQAVRTSAEGDREEWTGR